MFARCKGVRHGMLYLATGVAPLEDKQRVGLGRAKRVRGVINVLVRAESADHRCA